jgi:hypothetical protein
MSHVTSFAYPTVFIPPAGVCDIALVSIPQALVALGRLYPQDGYQRDFEDIGLFLRIDVEAGSLDARLKPSVEALYREGTLERLREVVDQIREEDLPVLVRTTILDHLNPDLDCFTRGEGQDRFRLLLLTGQWRDRRGRIQPRAERFHPKGMPLLKRPVFRLADSLGWERPILWDLAAHAVQKNPATDPERIGDRLIPFLAGLAVLEWPPFASAAFAFRAVQNVSGLPCLSTALAQMEETICDDQGKWEALMMAAGIVQGERWLLLAEYLREVEPLNWTTPQKIGFFQRMRGDVASMISAALALRVFSRHPLQTLEIFHSWVVASHGPSQGDEPLPARALTTSLTGLKGQGLDPSEIEAILSLLFKSKASPGQIEGWLKSLPSLASAIWKQGLSAEGNSALFSFCFNEYPHASGDYQTVMREGLRKLLKPRRRRRRSLIDDIVSCLMKPNSWSKNY